MPKARKILTLTNNFQELFGDAEKVNPRQLAELLNLHEKTVWAWIDNNRSDLIAKDERKEGAKNRKLFYYREDIKRIYPELFKKGKL